MSGKVARLFINGKADFSLRIAETDVRPDFDGRFRINDFFCRDWTWEMVLSGLVRESNVILMNLRGFSRKWKNSLNDLLNQLIIKDYWRARLLGGDGVSVVDRYYHLVVNGRLFVFCCTSNVLGPASVCSPFIAAS